MSKKPLSDKALATIQGTPFIRKDGTFDRSAIVYKARQEMRIQKIGWGEAQKYVWRVARDQMDKARKYGKERKPDIYETVAARLREQRVAAPAVRRVGKMPELSMGYGERL